MRNRGDSTAYGLSVQDLPWRKQLFGRRGADTLSYREDLPVKRVELDGAPEENIGPETGAPLVRIGEEVSRKLARKADPFYIIEYVRRVFVDGEGEGRIEYPASFTVSADGFAGFFGYA